MVSLPALRLGTTFVVDGSGNYLVDSTGLFITISSTVYPFCEDHGIVPAPGVEYSRPAINDRLDGVVDAIDVDGNGFLILRSNLTTLASFQLARPCGSVSDGILQFLGQLFDPSASATGFADNGIITTATGTLIASGLTVGIAGECVDILIDNGLGTTLVTSGQAISMISAQIQSVI